MKLIIVKKYKQAKPKRNMRGDAMFYFAHAKPKLKKILG